MLSACVCRLSFALGRKLQVWSGTWWLAFYAHVSPYELISEKLRSEEQHQLAADQMALAFVNGQQYMTSNIIGATSIEQLQRNIASIDVTLSEEILVAIEDIHHRYRIPSP